MKIVCIGGGPAGLYFGLLMKMRNPAHDITVVERNKPYDTFGWGVVFSDATMDNMRQWDPVTAAEIQQAFNHWDDIELEFKGEVIRSGGHGFVGIGRKKLLNILQARCEQLGVNLVFDTDVESDEDFPDADLIIASDGIFSKIRTKYETVFKPDIVVRPNRYIWLGTNKLYDAFTFLFEKTEHGWFQAHIYKFDETTTTFIVECPEHVWQAHRLDLADQAESIAFCEKVFARNLQGARLMTNARHLRGSAWLNFQRVKCEQWSLFNGKSHVVLMGDAVHTAHFAIGSGTKLAIEDAIELTRLFVEMGDTAAHIPEVLARYQEVRNVEVLKLQNAAWNAMAWFEVCGQRYCDRFEPQQFMYSMLTRSQRISHENLRLRDAQWLEGYEAWLAGGKAVPPHADAIQSTQRAAQKPHCGLTHGHIQCSRWRGARLSSGPLGRPRLGRCRHGVRGDDQPDARGAHHTRMPRLVERRASRSPRAHRALRPQPKQCQDGLAVGPQRPQGLHPVGLGGYRRTPARRQLAVVGRQRRGLWSAKPGAQGVDGARHDRHQAGLCRLDASRCARRF
jgi:anthraniloyl-CoA monooxygenase